MERVRRDIAAIVLVLAVWATALALFVARRITRELDANRRALSQRGADETAPADGGYRIREAQDMADAVRLMDASQRAAQTRRRSLLSHEDDQRDPRQAIARTQYSLFGPCTIRSGDRDVPKPRCGVVTAGDFFAPDRKRVV